MVKQIFVHRNLGHGMYIIQQIIQIIIVLITSTRILLTTVKSTNMVHPQQQPGGGRGQVFTLSQLKGNEKDASVQEPSEFSDYKEEYGNIYIPTKSTEVLNKSFLKSKKPLIPFRRRGPISKHLHVLKCRTI